MIRIIVKIFIIIAFMTIIGLLVPDQFSIKIDEAVVYFVSQIYNLDGFIHAQVLVDCLQLLIGYFLGLVIFFVMYWSIKKTEQ